MVDVPVNFGVEMTEITKAEYYDARKNDLRLPVKTPFGFVWSQGAVRILYVTYGGKFFMGRLGDKQLESWVQTFKWDGILQPAPQAVFHRVITKRIKPKTTEQTSNSDAAD